MDFSANKLSAFTITLGLTVDRTPSLYKNITLPPCRTPLSEAVTAVISCSDEALWNPLGMNEINVDVEILLEGRHRKTLRIQWEELGRAIWMLTSLGLFWDFNSYFHPPPLAQLLFLLNPTDSVLCRSTADLITFTRLLHIFSLSLFPPSDLIKSYFHATSEE